MDPGRPEARQEETPMAEPDERGWVWSEEVGLWFSPEGPEWLRAYKREGTPVRSYPEEAAFAQAEAERRAEAERHAQAETQRRTEAKRRVAELEAELARLRGPEAG